MELTSATDTTCLYLNQDIVVAHLWERNSHDLPVLGLVQPVCDSSQLCHYILEPIDGVVGDPLAMQGTRTLMACGCQGKACIRLFVAHLMAFISLGRFSILS
jgi:hypothetical protein